MKIELKIDFTPRVQNIILFFIIQVLITIKNNNNLIKEKINEQ